MHIGIGGCFVKVIFVKKYKGYYGKLGGGNSAAHSALIFEIRGDIVTEWSHNGKCRIWSPSNIRIPEMGKDVYKRIDLVGSTWIAGGVVPPDAEWSHMGSDSGNWQRKIANYLRDEIGVNISFGKIF